MAFSAAIATPNLPLHRWAAESRKPLWASGPYNGAAEKENLKSPPVSAPSQKTSDEKQRVAPKDNTIRRPDDLDKLSVWCDRLHPATLEPDEEAPALEKAYHALRNDADIKQYKDDVRFLRLCVRYAGVSEKPLEVFDTLEAHGVGYEHALLYEGWAASLEVARRFMEAEVVYLRGLERNAQPLPRLKERLEAFRRRQARRASRKAKPTKAKRGKLEAELPTVSQEDASPSALTDATSLTEATPGLSAVLERTSSGHRFQGLNSASSRPALSRSNSVFGYQAAAKGHRGGLRSRSSSLQRGAGVDSRSYLRAASIGAEATQELTTTCVRALLMKDRRSMSSWSGLSDRASEFDDPTCTMELAKNEVLGLFGAPLEAHERELDSPPGRMDMQPPASGSEGLLQGGGVNDGGGFAVFEESTGEMLGGLGFAGGFQVAERQEELHQVSSMIPVWDDQAFLEAMDE
eukprot:TRINITY_DN123339_c0_g1_i1.p1 TRINITY_DN123339_c0_g1~~TRINITY_DN123339_c0_g1_i1.p1  ORF type:complete len:462 (+),score=80.34 TRINITY_DN123339_c0_g1_i1:61-1446(+)